MSEPQYPVSELVSQAVFAALTTLTGAPGTSGYNTQLSAVERYIQAGNTPDNLKCVIFPPEDALLDDSNTPEGATSWDRTFQVTVYAGVSKTAATSYEQVLNIIRADVEKVMLAEINNSTCFGGYVQNCWAVGATIAVGPEEMPGVSMWFRMIYRTNQYDPYQQR